MFALLAAALAASLQSSAPEPAAKADAKPASPEAAAPSPVLETATPWWEKITVTVDGKGKQQSCLYVTSISPANAEACDKETAASLKIGSDGRDGLYSKVTFERRFSPGARVDSGRLQPGDTLIGRQVMFMTFAADGSIESCHVVSKSGDNPPDYDCAAVRQEQFRAQESADAGARQAFMTVMAYGHQEQIA